ncbi:MAG: Rha family transcriptional regulator [Desulfitobacterium sp.]
MSNLVFLEPNKLDAEPFTTSDVIAEYGKVKHHALQVLISKYQSDLEEFGKVSFEIRPLESGQSEKVYRLNEEQATLLITYMKNTQPVRNFKKALVRQFYAMRTELNRRHVERAQLKPIRREMTDIIQQATDNPWAYKQYTDLAYKTAVGCNAAQLRKQRGAGKKDKAVDYMTAEEIHAVSEMTYRIGVLLELGMDYHQVKAALSKRLLKTG